MSEQRTSNPIDDGLRAVQCPGCKGVGCDYCNEGVQLRLAAETIGEPDAWMTDDGRICTSQSKSSQSPGKTREFTIPLYRHPRPWSEVEKAALGPNGVPTSELVVALHKRCNDQSRELARLNAKLAECTAVKTSVEPT